MANNLITQELDFETIKTNLKNYLKSQDEFKGYEFVGSGMNILLDVLAYNTHYMGYYGHMLANESMIESIMRKENMNSKAKLFNYIPKSKRAAQISVTINKDPQAGSVTRVKVPRGTGYQAKSPLPGVTDARTFILPDDLFIYKNASDSFTSDAVTLYEGEYRTIEFLSSTEQRYVIQDDDVDTTTIRVVVKQNKAAEGYTTYTQAEDFNLIDGDSTNFFLTLNENDQYEIIFGNGIYGKAVEDGWYIEVTYIACNGELGNTVTEFVSSEITVLENSTDGTEPETLEDLRHNIPYHYRRQNRLVTVDDFKNIILSEYKNVSSVNVWGGEDNVPKAYGKVYVCVQPLFGTELSNQSQTTLLAMLKKYTMATVEPVIVSPDYLYIDLDVNVKNDVLKTDKKHGELRTDIFAAIEAYNSSQLNKFDSYYSDVKLNRDILATSDSFITTYNNITLEKRLEPILLSNQTYYVYFQNEITPGTVESTTFTFRGYSCKIVDDSNGNVEVYYFDAIQDKFIKFASETFGEVDYEEGVVKISDITFTAYDGDYLRLSAKPVKPLFFAKLNTILQIDNVVIHIEDYNGSESEK